MNTPTPFRALTLAVVGALLLVNPASARAGGAAAGRGEFTGRGFTTPRAGAGLSPGRSGDAAREGGRSPGGLDRGPRGGGRGPGDLRPGGTDGVRRGPTDRPGWDGRTPGRGHGHGHHHHHGHGGDWWYGRPGYWGSFGYGGFYDPFYSPFYSYGYTAREQDREDDRNVEVRVKPDNAQVYVNGLLYSNSGKARFTLPSGPWTIEIRAPGYRTEWIELAVEQGKRYRIERKLQRDETVGRDGRPLKAEELGPKER